MFKFAILAVIVSVSGNVHAEICRDFQTELEAALPKIPSPGVQLFAVLPDGKTCSIAVGSFETSKTIPMAASSQLKAWSISKTFTHAAILKLIESGELTLDKTLFELEMAYPQLYQGLLRHYPKSNQITIRQLLSHTSGIVDYMTLPEFYQKWEQQVKPGEVILTASRHQDNVAPGSLSRYSNTSMMILARIVESVSSSKFEDIILNQLIRPYSLTSTYISDSTTGWGDIYGYKLNQNGSFTDVTKKVSPSVVWGTGSIVSTSRDLSKWFYAVLNSQVLKRDITAQIFTPVKLVNGQDAEYGLGFRIQRFENGFVLIGHGGGPLEGNSATMLYSPQLKTMIVTMANGAEDNSNTILGGIGWKRAAEYFQNRR